MSKLDIGVGEEFPLDEGEDDGRPAWKHRHRGHHHHHHHLHRHGHGFRHRHGGRGLLHLPLLVGVAVIAAMIGAGRISPLASHAILAVAATLIVLALIAHFIHHRRWHRRAQ